MSRKLSDDQDPPGARVPNEELADLFDRFGGRMVSPGGAANLLGVSRQRVYALIRDGRLRCYRGPMVENPHTSVIDAIRYPSKPRPGVKWAYIPLDDVYAVGHELGRLTRRSS